MLRGCRQGYVVVCDNPCGGRARYLGGGCVVRFQLAKLGALEAKSALDATHLVTNGVRSSIQPCGLLQRRVVSPGAPHRAVSLVQVKRTLKFLQAISVVPFILDEDWVRDSLRAGNFVDEERYMLKYVAAARRAELHVCQCAGGAS